MGTYDDDVEEKLGNNAFNLILSYAESGKINNQQVADIAKELEPSVILGNHKRRGNKTGRNEMREILSDWCQFSDSFGAMSGNEALMRHLISIFNGKTVSLKPLASSFEKLLHRGTPKSIVPFI